MDDDLLSQKSFDGKTLKELLFEVADSESELKEIEEVFGPSSDKKVKEFKRSKFDN